MITLSTKHRMQLDEDLEQYIVTHHQAGNEVLQCTFCGAQITEGLYATYQDIADMSVTPPTMTEAAYFCSDACLYGAYERGDFDGAR